MNDDAIAARANLHRRIGAIEWRASPRALATEINDIRAIAHAHGMMPAVTVARLLEHALARGEHGPLVHAWLDMLRDAVASDRADAAACDTFAAACAVRFSG